MGAPGFWDDQEHAAKVSAEHARASRRLTIFRQLQADVEDLEPLAELADARGRLGACGGVGSCCRADSSSTVTCTW